jgi:hypothetical protein
VFHFRDFSASGEPDQAMADSAVGKVRAFFAAVQDQIPSVATITVMPDVPIIEETTNMMTGVLSTASVAGMQGNGGAGTNHAAAVGAVVTWRTNVVRNGRIIRGRTFLVPLVSTAFSPDGTLSSIALTALNNAATAARDATGNGDLGVLARPSSPGAADGQWAAVTAHSVPDMGAVMRSRRD